MPGAVTELRSIGLRLETVDHFGRNESEQRAVAAGASTPQILKPPFRSSPSRSPAERRGRPVPTELSTHASVTGSVFTAIW